LFNPLCLLLLPVLGSLRRGASMPGWARIIGTLIACMAGLALFLKFLPFRIQDNGDWIALMLPLQCALALRLSRTVVERPTTSTS
jgi:hypothetical protein